MPKRSAPARAGSSRKRQARPKPLSSTDWPAAALCSAYGVLLIVAPLKLGALDQAGDLIGAALTLAIGVPLALWAARRGRIPSRQLTDLGVLVLCAGAIASTIRTVDLYATLATLVRFLSYATVYACARLLAAHDFPALHRLGPASGKLDPGTPSPLGEYLLLGGLVAGAFISSCVGVRSYLINAFWLNNPSWRTFGDFYNPNAFAGYLGLAAFPALALLLLSRTPILRASGAIALLAILGALVLTASKGGLLAFVLAAAGFGAWRLGQSSRPWVRKVNPILAGVLVLLVFLIAVVAFPPTRIRLLATLREGHSALFRWYTWVATVRMALDRPLLGWGVGTYSQVMLRYKVAGFTGMAHNDYLQLWSEGGVLMIGGWLLALAGLARSLVRPATRGHPTRLLQVACAAGVAVFAIHGLADYDFYIQATGAAAFLLLGLALSDPPPPPEPKPLSRRARVSAYAVAALLILSLGFGASAGAALLHAKAAQQAMSQGGPTAAEAEFESAIRLMPLNGALHLEYGRYLYDLARNRHDLAAMRRGLMEVRRACALQPRESKNFKWLGLFRQGLDEPAAAQAAYSRALYLNPHYLSVYIASARLDLRSGDSVKAHKTLARVTEIEGSLYERVKAVPDLIELDYARVHLYLALLALNRGEGAAAIGEAQAARRTTEAYLHSSTVSALRESEGNQEGDPGPMLHALTYALEAEALADQPGKASALWQQAREAYPDAASLVQRLHKEWTVP